MEPQGERAQEVLELVEKITTAGVKKTGENTVTISMDPESLEKGKKKDNFRSTEMTLTLSAALDMDEKNSKKTPVQQFIRKFGIVCSSLKGGQKDGKGFYWDYYAPYFIEMSDRDLVEVFGYIAYASSSDDSVGEWLKAHESEVEKFLKWSKEFKWKAS